MSKQTSGWSGVSAAVVVVAVLVAGAYLAHRAMVANTQSPVPAVPAPAASAAPSIRYPIAQAALAGGDSLRVLLVPRQVIAHIVATIDALPRHAIGSRILPLHTPQGAFVADQAGGITVISDRNAARYAPYMRIVDSVDPRTLVAWY